MRAGVRLDEPPSGRELQLGRDVSLLGMWSRVREETGEIPPAPLSPFTP